MKMANRIQRRYRAKVRVEEAREVVTARKQEQVDHAAAVTIQAFFTNVIAIQMVRVVLPHPPYLSFLPVSMYSSFNPV
jgi:hypothetical protein